MSEKIEQRHVTDAYHCKVSRAGDGLVRFEVHGSTKSGRRVRIKIDARWSAWTCIVASFRNAWRDERASRMREIADIDLEVPKEEQ